MTRTHPHFQLSSYFLSSPLAFQELKHFSKYLNKYFWVVGKRTEERGDEEAEIQQTR